MAHASLWWWQVLRRMGCDQLPPKVWALRVVKQLQYFLTPKSLLTTLQEQLFMQVSDLMVDCLTEFWTLPSAGSEVLLRAISLVATQQEQLSMQASYAPENLECKVRASTRQGPSCTV